MPQYDLLRVGTARLSAAAVNSNGDYMIAMRDLKGELKILERSMVQQPILCLELAQPIDDEKNTKRMRIWIALKEIQAVIVRDSIVHVVSCAPFSVTHGIQAWNAAQQRRAQHAYWKGPQPRLELTFEYALKISRRLSMGLKNNQIKILNSLKDLGPKLKIAYSDHANIIPHPTALLPSARLTTRAPSLTCLPSTPTLDVSIFSLPAVASSLDGQLQLFPSLADDNNETLLTPTLNITKDTSLSLFDFDFDFTTESN
mmetsp:Transcript_6811/g.10099  ORF Transcript_6811/g.10099 Transcript_6811/m.10099 type:complete len:257 (+) Transcript_6811:68-838(+)